MIHRTVMKHHGRGEYHSPRPPTSYCTLPTAHLYQGVRVQVGNLVRDGVRVRVIDGVRVIVAVRVNVLERVGVIDRVSDGVKLSVGTRVSDGVSVITGVLVGVRDTITPRKLTPATYTWPSRALTTEFWLPESTATIAVQLTSGAKLR